MKVTFNNNNSFFTFELDYDKFGEGSFNFINVTCDDLEITDVDIELEDVWTTQHIGEIEIDYIMNEEEWSLLYAEVKRQILDDPTSFDAHEYISDEDKWNWFNYEQQQIEQANEDKF
jgi:hypothetical protein